jgi:hypothetical protein
VANKILHGHVIDYHGYYKSKFLSGYSKKIKKLNLVWLFGLILEQNIRQFKQCKL